jgi:TPR repeat protein
LYLAWLLSDHSDDALLTRVSEMGYGPAQAHMALVMVLRSDFEAAFGWAEKSAAAGGNGIARLGGFWLHGWGCEYDLVKAVELLKVAAEWGHPAAQFEYGMAAFGLFDWRRYHWCGLAPRGPELVVLQCDVLSLLPWFERREHGRILHTVAPLIRRHIAAQVDPASDEGFSDEETSQLKRVLELHDEMCARARVAIHCWSAVGLRNGVVKDVRVLIAKNLWAELWWWGGEKTSGVKENAKRK